MPPDVVLILASSTVFVKASSLVNRDLGGIVYVARRKLRRLQRVPAVHDDFNLQMPRVPQSRSTCPRAGNSNEGSTETVEQ